MVNSTITIYSIYLSPKELLLGPDSFIVKASSEVTLPVYKALIS